MITQQEALEIFSDPWFIFWVRVTDELRVAEVFAALHASGIPESQIAERAGISISVVSELIYTGIVGGYAVMD